MATLAIKGHPTRGNEVIEILEMLGGRNLSLLFGDSALYYAINREGIISTHCEEQVIQFSLEEFLEKFPYKVGDKVYYQPIPQINSVCISEIISMRWIDGSVVYYTSNGHEVFACDLLPYKEETMEEKLEQITFDIPDGYEFFGINDDNQVVLAKKQPQYLKTYEECCKELGHPAVIMSDYVLGYKGSLLNSLQKLLICRAAYWKIAGDEMGLDKPWKPDWNDCAQHKFGLYTLENEIRCINLQVLKNIILVFPTEEMRDAFYENFNELIVNCKELL